MYPVYQIVTIALYNRIEIDANTSGMDFGRDRGNRGSLFENSKRPVVTPRMTGKSVVPAGGEEKSGRNRKEDRKGEAGT